MESSVRLVLLDHDACVVDDRFSSKCGAPLPVLDFRLFARLARLRFARTLPSHFLQSVKGTALSVISCAVTLCRPCVWFTWLPALLLELLCVVQVDNDVASSASLVDVDRAKPAKESLFLEMRVAWPPCYTHLLPPHFLQSSPMFGIRSGARCPPPPHPTWPTPPFGLHSVPSSFTLHPLPPANTLPLCVRHGSLLLRVQPGALLSSSLFFKN